MGAEWTADQDDALFRLYVKEGHSASQTALLLPGERKSRAAVIGRANRLGLKREGASAPTVKAPYPKRAAPQAVRRKFQGTVPGWRDDNGPVKPTRPSAVTDIPSPNAKAWTERAFGECAYPVSGEGADTVSCCNHTAETYCPAHRALMTDTRQRGKVYVPDGPKPRRKADTIFSAWLAA